MVEAITPLCVLCGLPRNVAGSWPHWFLHSPICCACLARVERRQEQNIEGGHATCVES